ncbi:MAG: ABC transporter permease [Tannerellaceae bacterium]|jgi:putative ABC transport system permease protein|nr:ABC transporter permease [Tannerellaceae bacterium]
MNHLFNFKSFFRFLRKNQLYTAINVCGLGLSLMFVILIAAYTAGELLTDSGRSKKDRMYLLTNAGGSDKDLEVFYGTAFRLSDRLAERYPEIEMLCPIAPQRGTVVANIGGDADNRFQAELLFADSTFFSMFDFPLLQGSAGEVLKDKMSAVVSDAFARRAFPGRNPVGEVVRLRDTLVFTVSGVMKNIRGSSIREADIIIRIDNVGYFNSSMDSPEFNNAGSALIFALAREGTDLRSLSDDMTAYFKEIFWFYRRGIFTRADFTPYRDVYFSGIEDGEMLNSGNRELVRILLLVGLLILGFAVTNYINLTTAQAGFRAREMAARRLLGSTRRELVVRLVLESTVLSLIAFVAGLLLALAAEGYASMLLEKTISIAELVSPVSLAGCIALVALLGIAAGIIPAIIISRVKPVDIMKGSLRTKSKMVLSKVFITFQNTITIALIAASLTMLLQLNHLVKAPLGYRTQNIIDIPTDNIGDKQKMIALRNELAGLACVQQTSFCAGTPYTRGNNNTIVYKGRNLSTQHLTGDSAFLSILGLEVLRNNGLESGKGIFLTQYALKEFELPDDAAEVLFNDSRTEQIAGIVRDFHLRDITAPEQPVIIRIRDMEREFYPWNLLVAVQGNPSEAYSAVQEAYGRVIKLDFDGKFIDRQVADNFASLWRTSTIVSLFASIALLISLLGLVAMSTYYVRRRAKEVAVRKVFGSNKPDILMRLTGSFLIYVGLAFLIAVPVIWYLMRGWLSAYEHRIALSPAIFAGAGLFCLLVSFIAVFRQSYQAAEENPIKSLKSE